MDQPSKNNGAEDLNKFQAALQLLQYEQQILWLIFGAFLLPQTVLLGFLLDSALKADPNHLWHVGRFIIALLGLLICVPWFAAYKRNAAYYFFRMSQAKAAEPTEWYLLREEGENFADGHEVKINGEPHQLPCLSRAIRTRSAIPMLMLLFPIIYIVLMLLNVPWCSLC
jgi:hypothetical protein